MTQKTDCVAPRSHETKITKRDEDKPLECVQQYYRYRTVHVRVENTGS